MRHNSCGIGNGARNSLRLAVFTSYFRLLKAITAISVICLILRDGGKEQFEVCDPGLLRLTS